MLKILENFYRLQTGSVTSAELNQLEKLAFEVANNTHIYFDETPAQDIYQFKSKCRQLVTEHGVGLIIVDYLQLMTSRRGNNETREQEVSKVSRELKALAIELKIPIIALSQLNRKGDPYKPILADLRDSGSLEQDADIVAFLVNIPEDDVKNNPDFKDSIFLEVAKNRHGRLAQLQVRCLKNIQKIMSEEEYENYQSS